MTPDEAVETLEQWLADEGCHPPARSPYRAVCVTLEENERLRAEVKRLESRGIEDMRHSIDAALRRANEAQFGRDALHAAAAEEEGRIKAPDAEDGEKE